MVKEFLCHKSANKFDIKDSGVYVDKYMNSINAQYLMVYHITNTDAPKSSNSDDSHSSLNDDCSSNSLKKNAMYNLYVWQFLLSMSLVDYWI